MQQLKVATQASISMMCSRAAFVTEGWDDDSFLRRKSRSFQYFVPPSNAKTAARVWKSKSNNIKRRGG